MLQNATDEALRAEDDLAEAIDLIWMRDAAVRDLDFDPDTPTGLASTVAINPESVSSLHPTAPGYPVGTMIDLQNGSEIVKEPFAEVVKKLETGAARNDEKIRNHINDTDRSIGRQGAV